MIAILSGVACLTLLCGNIQLQIVDLVVNDLESSIMLNFTEAHYALLFLPTSSTRC